LVAQELGPLAYARFREPWPELASRLKADLVSAVAESSLHDHSLERIEAAFQEAGIPILLLKGAALAESAYPDPIGRPMSDVDIWLPEKHVAMAVGLMQQLGFQAHGKRDRPPELQMLSSGEFQFSRQDWGRGLVELHWTPLSGWWQLRAATIDGDAAWSRKQRLASRGAQVFQLAPEDMVLQVAVHLAVNHQFGMTALRGLVDIALTAGTRPVDWSVVAGRAREWRVATAVWAVLDLLEQLIGVPGAEEARRRLRPSPLRRKLLERFVSAGSVLAGIDLRGGRRRYLLLLLLVDRPRDMLRLIFRTLWPEKAWMDARYQEPTSRWDHLWAVLRYGRV
jgi:hypothetical protein